MNVWGSETLHLGLEKPYRRQITDNVVALPSHMKSKHEELVHNEVDSYQHTNIIKHNTKFILIYQTQLPTVGLFINLHLVISECIEYFSDMVEMNCY